MSKGYVYTCGQYHDPFFNIFHIDNGELYCSCNKIVIGYMDSIETQDDMAKLLSNDSKKELILKIRANVIEIDKLLDQLKSELNLPSSKR